jgi:hypothetical protein
VQIVVYTDGSCQKKEVNHNAICEILHPSKQSTLRQKKNDGIRQVTVYLKSVDPNGQFRSVMIHIFMILEGNYSEKMVVAYCNAAVYL